MDDQIDAIFYKEKEATTTLEGIKTLQQQLKDASDEKYKLERALRLLTERLIKLLSEQNRLLKNQLPGATAQQILNRNNQNLNSISLEKRLETNITDNKEKQKEMKDEIERLETRIKELETQIDDSKKKEEDAKQQLKDADEQKRKLENQRTSVTKDEQAAKKELTTFSGYAKAFHEILKGFSVFTFTNDTTINQYLNLDLILASRVNRQELNYACTTAHSSIKDLRDRMNRFYRESDSAFTGINGRDIVSDIDKACTIAYELARQFDTITSNGYAQQFDSFLNDHCNKLIENRTRLRSDKSIRQQIIYSAKVLADHLSYWSRNTPLAQQYFDIYVAFTMLEERARKNFPAREGILLVRARKTTNSVASVPNIHSTVPRNNRSQ